MSYCIHNIYSSIEAEAAESIFEIIMATLLGIQPMSSFLEWLERVNKYDQSPSERA